MRFCFRSILLLTTLLLSFRLAAEALVLDAAAEKILDLSNENFTDQNFHVLRENWQVYWGELLVPSELEKHREASELRPLLNIGKIDNPDFSSPPRFGSFHIKIRLPEHTAPFAIQFPEIHGASRIWLNGLELAKNGKVSPQAKGERIQMRIFTSSIDSGVRDLDLLIQASSHTFRNLGPISPIKIGTRLAIDRNHWHAMMRDIFALSAILIMSFYHFALYLVRRKGVEALLFGAFCLTMSIMTICNSEGHLLYMIFDKPYTPLVYRIQSFAFPLASVIMAYYAHLLYVKFIPLKLVKVIALGSAVYASVTVFGPLRFIDATSIPFQIFSMSAGIIYIALLCRAAIRKADGSLLFLIGFALIIGGAINDILKGNGVIESQSASHITLFGFVLLQSIILSKRFAQAFVRLEEMEAEIHLLNIGLEKKVEERTATIRMIIDNVKSGFLLIDCEMQIQDGFTKSCVDILDQTIEVGDYFPKLFKISKREQADLEMAIAQVFEDYMPESVTLSLIKSRLPVRKHQVMIQSAVIRDQQQKIHSILITLTDATQLTQMETEAKISQTLVKILQAQINFKSLLLGSFQDLDRAQDLVKIGDDKNVRLLLHTIKGNLSTFGLEQITQFAHNLEDQETISALDLSKLEQEICHFLETYKDVLKIDPTALHEKSYNLVDRDLIILSDQLKSKGVSADILHTIGKWVEDVKQISFDELIGPIAKKVEKIGEGIGKHVELRITGGDLAVDADRMQSVVHSLIHLIRNSIDHGLEFPSERGSKPARGQIFIKVSRDIEIFRIEVGDDGRGIDPNIIKKTALSKGLISNQQAPSMSEQEILQLIFRSGFSTRTEVTSLSGRGVGMSAIESAVLELGGRISITTTIGEGTRFVIDIPEAPLPQDQRRSA